MSYLNRECVCECCGSVTGEPVAVYANGSREWWCPDCVDAHGVTCEHCDNVYSDESELMTVHEGSSYRSFDSLWCQPCVSSDAIVCSDCGELWDENDMETVYLWDGSRRSVCPSCLEHYYTCERCGESVHEDDIHNDGYDTLCPDCYSARYDENGDKWLESYYHTDGCYFWDDNGACVHYSPVRGVLYLGVELETSDNDDPCDVARQIVEGMGRSRFSCKKDCTLGAYGVEIVSQPMTLGYHLTSGIWQDVVDIVRDNNGVSHNGGRCGLHVHISRTALVDGADYRIDRLVHRFWPQLLTFSRRRDTDYCKLDGTMRNRSAWRDYKHSSGDRYVAVNVENYNTVELRLWRGTLNLATLYATLEMTAALALVANELTDKDVEVIGWDAFKRAALDALDGIGARSCELVEYLKSKSL